MCLDPITAIAAVGTVVSTVGQVASASAQASAYSDQSRMIVEQQDQMRDRVAAERRANLALGAVEDARVRDRFAAEMADQRLQLAARGVSLDSPAAIAFGEQAAREMSFASQSVRSGVVARDTELSQAAATNDLQMTNNAVMASARARNAIIEGTFGAASTVLTAAPKLFPGLDEEFA